MDVVIVIELANNSTITIEIFADILLEIFEIADKVSEYPKLNEGEEIIELTRIFVLYSFNHLISFVFLNCT
jgi:hypothetical protein